MRLMLRARFLATMHLWHRFNLFRRGHRIWRLYRYHGWQTFVVFCECGKEFQ